MLLSWVLLFIAVISVAILSILLIRGWEVIPSFLRWFAGFNVLIVLVNIMCLCLTIKQQNNFETSDHYIYKSEWVNKEKDENN